MSISKLSSQRLTENMISPAVITSGGTKTTYIGNGTNGITGQNYEVYTFTSSGSLVVATAGLATILVVAAGASGGAPLNGWSAGGGGAGGHIESNYWLTAQTYTVTVPPAPTNGNGSQAKFVGTDVAIYVPGGGKGGENNSGGATGGCNGQGNSGTPSLDGLFGYTSVGGYGGGGGGVSGEPYMSSITGTLTGYCYGGNAVGGGTVANSGNGGAGCSSLGPQVAGNAGVVIVRVKTGSG